MENRVTFGTLLLLLIISLFTMAFNINSVSASLPVHNIDSGEDFATIQAAINDMNTLDGHTIRVDPGIYNERLTINKSIILMGTDKFTTKIDGNNAGTVIDVLASNVTISEFTIMRSGNPSPPVAAIYIHASNACLVTQNILTSNKIALLLDNSSFNTVESNVISGNVIGIKLSYSNRNVIVDNNINQNWLNLQMILSSYNEIHLNQISESEASGIDLWKSNDNNLTQNTISGSKTWGIIITTSEKNTLVGNTMINNKYNLRVFGIMPSEFIQNIDSSNTADGKYVYYLIGKTNLKIDSSTHSNAASIAIIDSSNVTVEGLSMAKNGDALLFVNTTNSFVRDVTLEENFYGIHLVHSTNVTMNGNSMNSNDYGLFLENSDGNRILTNGFVSNGAGIYLEASENNTVFQNQISDSINGIELRRSTSNSIIGNDISDSRLGMYIYNSSNNLIYHNNFLYNKNQISHQDTEMSSNTWDNGYGGNFWSDYLGEDLDGDGVGDTSIPHLGVDWYPLMDQYVIPEDATPPTISILSPENKTYPTNEVLLMFTVSEPTSWICYSLDSQSNVTISGNTTLFGLSDGTHIITVYANDTAGNMGSPATVYFTVDTVPPNIEILLPENKTYTTSSVTLSFTVDEATSWIGYSLDGKANVTITGNTTLSGLSEGSHSLIVYAKDLAGNIGTSEMVYFTVGRQQPEPEPTEPSQLWIIAIIVIVAGAGAAFLVYLTKVKKPTEKVK